MSNGPDLVPLLLIALIIFIAVLAIRWIRGAQGLFVTVYEWEYALSYFDGRFDRLLPPGRHFSWTPQRRVVYRLKRGDQLHVTAVTDVTSSDRLVYRLGATLTYRYADPRMAFEDSHIEKINLAATTALPRIAAARTLEALLSERPALDGELLGLIGSSVAGCEIVAATIGTVILPPEVRRLFSEVERARLEGAAALERARGEQAALRSLANSARMLKGNPELMNLRLLQSLSSKGKATLVLGSNALLPVSSEGDAPLADS